jgi:MIP family channel proteins
MKDSSISLDIDSVPNTEDKPKMTKVIKNHILNSFKLPKIISYCAEFTGTFFFVFASIGNIAVATYAIRHTLGGHCDDGDCSQTAIDVPFTFQVAMGFGYMSTIIVYTLGRYSGAHINPIITLGSFLFDNFGLIPSLLYMILQCGGATLATWIVSLLFPIDKTFQAGLNVPSINDYTATVCEMAGSFILAYAVHGSKKSSSFEQAYLIGITIFVCHIILIPITGCGINPARSLGPAIISGEFSKLWIYVVGPVVGGILGAAMHFIPLQCKGCLRLHNRK